MNDCIFCKIVAGDIPSQKVYEDDDMIIINDINPQMPVHMLLIPKAHYDDVTGLDGDTAAALARCLVKLKDITAKIPALKDGFRLINNKGDAAGQTVKHMHIHILGGAPMNDRLV